MHDNSIKKGNSYRIDAGTRLEYQGEKDILYVYYATTSGGNPVYTYVRS